MMLSPGTKPVKFVLSKKYREELVARKVNWRMPGLSQMTFLRTYARKKDNGKLESWAECVARVIEGQFSILKTHAKQSHMEWDEKRGQRLAQEAADRMFAFKWTPPGRGLWIMGTDFMWEKGGAALNNCFSSDTMIVTPDGVLSLNDAKAVDDLVVVDRFGNYRAATVRSFGEQQLNRYDFAVAGGRGCRVTHSIRATRDHRWYLEDGSVTQNLSVGDHVIGIPTSVGYDSSTPEYLEGFVHGCVFADGTQGYRAVEHTTYWVRLCGDKNKHRAILEKSRYYHKTSVRDGDAFVYFKVPRGTYEYLKAIPNSRDPSYRRGFVDAWLELDGSRKQLASGDRIKISSTDESAMVWLNYHASEFGLLPVTEMSVRTGATNYSEERKPLYQMKFSTGKVTYYVKSVTLDEVEEVLCVIEPETTSFVLAGGLMTGNCGFVSTERMGESIDETIAPFHYMSEMSMFGVGVGFDTKGAGKITLGRPDVYLEKPTETFVVPDSREGWSEAICKTIRSYVDPEHPQIVLDVSLVRPEGSPLKGFGGVASGPGPLVRGCHMIGIILSKRMAHPDGQHTITSVDITDLMNTIGKVIVSGGIRRTAQIAFSDPHDVEFFSMKKFSEHPVAMGAKAPEELERVCKADYDLYNANSWNPKVTEPIAKKYSEAMWAFKFGGWRWTSNNSVFAKVGMDYKPFADAIVENGEPGFQWLDLARAYGRLGDPANFLDHRVAGANPCVEQSLEPEELCCLVENFPAHCSDYWDFQRTLKFSYLYAKAVTLMATHHRRTNAVIARNRRIGASMSGIVEAIGKFGRTTFLHEWCENGYKYVDQLDRKYSEWLGVPRSIKKTSVKPSGTVSLVAGSYGPGIHHPKMASGYRLIRVQNNSELIKPLIAAGYRVEAALSDPLTASVVYFPWLTPANIKDESEANIWEQMKLAADLQRWWSDNQVSCTIGFTEEEGKGGEIARVLEAFDGQIKGVSFLPKAAGSYDQMPFTKAPREEVEAYIATLREVDYTDLTEESTDAASKMFCDGAQCQLI